MKIPLISFLILFNILYQCSYHRYPLIVVLSNRKAEFHCLVWTEINCHKYIYCTTHSLTSICLYTVLYKPVHTLPTLFHIPFCVHQAHSFIYLSTFITHTFSYCSLCSLPTLSHIPFYVHYTHSFLYLSMVIAHSPSYTSLRSSHTFFHIPLYQGFNEYPSIRESYLLIQMPIFVTP